MIILTHDGSIYSDWVAHYALHLSAVEADRKLLALYVQDGKISPEIVVARFNQLAAECSALGVEFLAQHLPLGSSVYRTLRQAIPHDPDALLICGTRLKPRRQRYLAGSVSEKLLRTHQCPVLALRVVQPGLLGSPQDLLVPLAGHQQGFKRIEPIIRRMAPQIRFVQMCRIMMVNPLRHPHLSSDMEQKLKHKGRCYLGAFLSDMKASLGSLNFRCDQKVIIASDWGGELLMQASRLKTQLLLLGLSERSLAYRVFHSVTIERILLQAPCDVGIYRS